MAVSPQRPTLGILVDRLEHQYQSAVVAGALEAAQHSRSNLLCFVGGILGSTRFRSAERNHIFDLAAPENVDALIVMAGSVGSTVGPEALLEYCARFRPLPLCSISVELPGAPSVLVDNDRGMRHAVAHLVQVHGCRRIGFIRGPEHNPEAERRFGIYRDVLADSGIDFDPNLAVLGDFQHDSGRAAIRTLFDERRLRPELVDAVVGANDQMAIGAMEELERRGIRVPDRVALVGFDDIPEARYSSPPLTTVRQPLKEQGRFAVRLALARLAGEKPESVTLHTELVTRRSCRCFTHEAREHPTLPPKRKLGFEAAFVERRDIIHANLVRAARASFQAAGAGWESRLLSALVAQLRGEDRVDLAELFEDMLRRVLESGGDVSACHDVISALRRDALACLDADLDRRAATEEILQEVRIVAATVVERAQAQMRLRVEEQARRLRGSAALLTFDMNRLARAAAEQLPVLGINSCYICLFEDDGLPPKRARAAFALRAGKTLPVGADSFPVHELVPRSLLPDDREYAFVIEPLFFEQDQLGYALFELGPTDGTMHEVLRDQISTALKGAKLTRQLLEARRA